ncbi:MAG: pseudouridine synthase [Candidatus Omnitrophica bacterium]|nr:pseudouridine synthase [Candidatus Omnitrophota bacterium]
MEKRLQNILAEAGVASRRASAELIESFQVKVDGKVVTRKGLRPDPGEHDITVSGKPLPERQKKRYFLLYKPPGMISTAKDTHGRDKILDLFRGIEQRLYPVGRLDKDTTGIILVTNDGKFANRLAHPRYEINKEYVVSVKRRLNSRDRKTLEKGVELDGKRTSPCSISFIKKEGDLCSYSINIHEGRKRQVRRMFASLGLKVHALKRTGYAGLTLKGLKPGEYRELTREEVSRLKNGEEPRPAASVKRKKLHGRRGPR